MKPTRRALNTAIATIESEGFNVEVLDDGANAQLTIYTPSGRLLKRLRDSFPSVVTHVLGFAEGMQAMKGEKSG